MQTNIQIKTTVIWNLELFVLEMTQEREKERERERERVYLFYMHSLIIKVPHLTHLWAAIKVLFLYTSIVTHFLDTIFFSKLAKAHKLSTAVTNIAKDCVNPFVGSQLLVMMLRILNVIKIKEKMSHWVKLDLLYLTCISKHMQEFNDLKLFMETTYLIVLKYWA